MRRIILALSLLATPALAQAQQQPADPNTQALGQMVLEGAQREAAVRAQLITAQARIAALEAQASKADASSAKPQAPSPAP